MKTKEIRERLHKQREQGLLSVLETMNEELLQTRRDLHELAHHFDKLVDTLNNVVEVQGQFKERILRNEQKDDDMNSSTNSLAVDNKL